MEVNYLSSLQDVTPQKSSKDIPKEAKASCLEAKCCDSAICPVSSSKNLALHHYESLQPKLFPAFSCSARYFLFVSSGRSSRVLFPIGPSVTRVRNLSSMHSRNLPGCLLPAVLSLWRIWEWFELPVTTRISIMRWLSIW